MYVAVRGLKTISTNPSWRHRTFGLQILCAELLLELLAKHDAKHGCPGDSRSFLDVNPQNVVRRNETVMRSWAIM